MEKIIERCNFSKSTYQERSKEGGDNTDRGRKTLYPCVSHSNEKYKIIGFSSIDPLPSQSMVRANYKKLCLKYHPDRNTDSDANEKFANIAICSERGFTC